MTVQIDAERGGDHGHDQVKNSDVTTDEKGTDVSKDSSPSPPADRGGGPVYLKGARFWSICLSIAIMMFMTNLEVPVVTTALVSITDALGGFDQVGWVVSSYLLGYVAVIVIFAKFSDLLGRKMVFILSVALFVIFSAACSAAQTIVQLIVFRALQGMGGGGCFSLCTIMITELVPPEERPKYVSYVSLTNAIALLCGPIVGGGITSSISWRWIFIINVPIATPVLVIAYLAIPHDFPFQGQAHPHSKGIKTMFTRSNFDRLDIPGTLLLLCATVGLTAGFEEADNRFPWKSAYVITLVTVSGILWIALVLWERHVTLAATIREPILPWTFLSRRQMLGTMLNFAFLGGPTIITIFIVPQRFQLVYGLSGLQAGVRLIPFTLAIAFGSVFGSTLASKRKIPPIYLVLVGSCLQVIAFALLSNLSLDLKIAPKIYGFEIIAGWGCGINFALLFIMVPFLAGRRDHAVGLGTAAQMRMIGSAIVLAISTSVFNSYVRPEVAKLLNVPDAASAVLSGRFIATLEQGLQVEVRQILAEGYNRQTLVLCISAALQIPASLMVLDKKPLTI
ncbi:putative multidrug resistance protein fnx1 [Xylariaceae sp. FL0016]|nr:putative multidrug resistance protein fnx1 [Xylariaceae sp. FL0016]